MTDLCSYCMDAAAEGKESWRISTAFCSQLIEAVDRGGAELQTAPGLSSLSPSGSP